MIDRHVFAYGSTGTVINRATLEGVRLDIDAAWLIAQPALPITRWEVTATDRHGEIVESFPIVAATIGEAIATARVRLNARGYDA